jgi:hypothetical protein
MATIAEGKTKRTMIIPDDLWSDLQIMSARNHSSGVTAEVIRAAVEYLRRHARP